MPVETAQRQALLALALWLGAPGGEPSLPLDARVLAAVTVQVCHAMRLAPGALDALDAADVELLWRASRGDASVAGDDSEGTRIVIVPAAPSDHPDTRPTIEREHAAAVGVRPERTLALDGAPSAPAVDTTRPHDAGAHFVGAPVTLETTAAPPTNAASSGREADGIAPASGLPRGDRFRLRLEGARPTSPVPAVPANASRRTPTVQAPPIIQSPASEAPAHTWPWPVTGVVALAAGPSLAAPDTDEGAPGARLGFAPQPRSDALRAAASSSSDPAAG